MLFILTEDSQLDYTALVCEGQCDPRLYVNCMKECWKYKSNASENQAGGVGTILWRGLTEASGLGLDMWPRTFVKSRLATALQGCITRSLIPSAQLGPGISIIQWDSPLHFQKRAFWLPAEQLWERGKPRFLWTSHYRSDWEEEAYLILSFSHEAAFLLHLFQRDQRKQV